MKMNEEILIKTSKYGDAPIMSILNQAENGVPVADFVNINNGLSRLTIRCDPLPEAVPVADLCREHGMSGASF